MNPLGKLEKIWKYGKYAITVYTAACGAALWLDAEVKKRRYRKKKEVEARKKAAEKPDPAPDDGKKRRR